MMSASRVGVGLLALCVAASCATPRGGGEQTASSLLVLRVTPEDAEVYLDDAYQGVVSRWRDGAIPVRPGELRVELRAPGHLPERFDVRVAPREEITLSVALEPTFELPQADDDDLDDDVGTPRSPRRSPKR